MYHEIYELNPTYFLSTPRLAWQAPYKNNKVKLDLFLCSLLRFMLLMVEKGIRGGICHGIYQFLKVNNKYMKNYDKNKDPWYPNYWDVNNFYGQTMSQKLTVNNFKWVEETSQVKKAEKSRIFC